MSSFSKHISLEPEHDWVERLLNPLIDDDPKWSDTLKNLDANAARLNIARCLRSARSF